MGHLVSRDLSKTYEWDITIIQINYENTIFDSLTHAETPLGGEAKLRDEPKKTAGCVIGQGKLKKGINQRRGTHPRDVQKVLNVEASSDDMEQTNPPEKTTLHEILI